MLRDNGPVSSFEEDVKALGIGHLFENGTKAQKAEAAPMTEQDEQDEKKENPFAKYNAEKADKKDDSEDEDEDEEKDEEPKAKSEAEDDEDEDEDEETEEEQDDSLFGAMCDEDEKLDAAVDVLDAFYSTIAESEDGAEFDHDSLVGVIEAYEYMAEATGLLDEAKLRKGRRATSQKRREARLAGHRAHKGGAEKRRKASEHAAGKSGKVVVRRDEKGKMHKIRGREAMGLKAMSQAQRRYKGYSVKLSGGGTARPAMKKVHSDVEQDGSPITELVGNLAALKEAVKSNVDYRQQAEELKEGFNAIGETASTWMESIATEVKKSVAETENYDADNDPRVHMGRHLDGIAESAALIIAKLDEGEANLEDAASDLQNLSADLNDAAEAMKGIE